jgi:hypothetical protein
LGTPTDIALWAKDHWGIVSGGATAVVAVATRAWRLFGLIPPALKERRRRNHRKALEAWERETFAREQPLQYYCRPFLLETWFEETTKRFGLRFAVANSQPAAIQYEIEGIIAIRLPDRSAPEIKFRMEHPSDVVGWHNAAEAYVYGSLTDVEATRVLALYSDSNPRQVMGRYQFSCRIPMETRPASVFFEFGQQTDVWCRKR